MVQSWYERLRTWQKRSSQQRDLWPNTLERMGSINSFCFSLCTNCALNYPFELSEEFPKIFRAHLILGYAIVHESGSTISRWLST